MNIYGVKVNLLFGNALNLIVSKILLFCKELTLYQMKKFKPFSKQQILDSSKLKEFVDHNFRFDKNCRKLWKLVENTVRKGEIARYELFFFPQCFQKTSIADTLKPFPHNDTF